MGLTGKWDIDGGDGDKHRIELLADGRWAGLENLFCGEMPRWERPNHIANLQECCVLGRSMYRHYLITRVTGT